MPPFDGCLGVFCDVSSPTGRTLVHELVSDSIKEADIGSGFGLFFVDSLVDGYGGSVTVTDNDPRGAVFEVRLPKTDSDAGDPGS